MDTVALITFPPISDFGAMLILAGSLLAALAGVATFAWGMVLLWRENNPQGIMMRGQERPVDDREDNEMVEGTRPKQKLLAWVNR
jgi:hypothetical protein